MNAKKTIKLVVAYLNQDIFFSATYLSSIYADTNVVYFVHSPTR